MRLALLPGGSCRTLSRRGSPLDSCRTHGRRSDHARTHHIIYIYIDAHGARTDKRTRTCSTREKHTAHAARQHRRQHSTCCCGCGTHLDGRPLSVDCSQHGRLCVDTHARTVAAPARLRLGARHAAAILAARRPVVTCGPRGGSFMFGTCGISCGCYSADVCDESRKREFKRWIQGVCRWGLGRWGSNRGKREQECERAGNHHLRAAGPRATARAARARGTALTRSLAAAA